MRRSTTSLALAVGCAAVLALVIGLFGMTRSDPPAAAPSPAPAAARSEPAPAAPPAPSVAAPAARPGAARELLPASPPRGHYSAPVQPSLGVSLGSRDLKRDANGHLVPIVTMKELRAQIDRTDAPMKACIERSGALPTGKATLSFTVAARNGRLAVETTSVQDDDTLAAYPELLDCMHRTAGALALDGKPVPELGTPIYVRRHVRVDHGALVENTFFDFSYNP